MPLFLYVAPCSWVGWCIGRRPLPAMPHMSMLAYFPPGLLSIDLLIVFAGDGGIGHLVCEVDVYIAADVGI